MNILYPTKLRLKSNGEMKTSLANQKLSSVASRPAFHGILKVVLQKEGILA